jgi:hypothetical protein
MSFRRTFVALSLALGTALTAQGAEEPDLKIRFIGTDHPSSFAPLIRVRFTNRAYTAANLSEMMASSQLMIDGKASARTAAGFDGPAGIAPLGDWEGCLSPGEYSPVLTPGRHQISFRLGKAESNAVKVRWAEPLVWQKGTLKTRSQEIRDLAAGMDAGLPRSCVEQWLTVEDGGMQEADHIRYYLEPGFKMVVPYSQAAGGGAVQAVNGPVQVYLEDRLSN